MKFILLIRDPKEVVASLLARPNDPITRRSAFKLWIESVLTAEHATRHFDRTIVMADNLFEAPAAVQADIKTFLRWDSKSRDLSSASLFIDTSLRHQYSGKEMLRKDDLITMQCGNIESLSVAIYNVFRSGDSCIDEFIMDDYRRIFAF
jgi:hypothetical protein